MTVGHVTASKPPVPGTRPHLAARSGTARQQVAGREPTRSDRRSEPVGRLEVDPRRRGLGQQRPTRDFAEPRRTVDRHVSAGEFRGDTGLDLDAAATRLNVLARRLAQRGLQVAVEGFPWSALAGKTAVPELLRRVQAPNVGQLIDVWHFFNNGGTPDAVTGPIAAVQLNDGLRVHGDYLRHARAARRLPGGASWTSSACCRPCSAAASPAPGASR